MPYFILVKAGIFYCILPAAVTLNTIFGFYTLNEVLGAGFFEGGIEKSFCLLELLDMLALGGSLSLRGRCLPRRRCSSSYFQPPEAPRGYGASDCFSKPYRKKHAPQKAFEPWGAYHRERVMFYCADPADRQVGCGNYRFSDFCTPK